MEIDGNSLHILHDEIRAAIPGVAGIHHVNDGRMIQRCQKLPFFEKAVTPSGTMAIEAKELDGNRLLNFTIRPLAEIDRAHAASPEQPDQTIWSQSWTSRPVT